MNRTHFIFSNTFTSLTVPLLILFALAITSCTAPPKEKHYTVGIINPNANLNLVVEGFKLSMTGYGYIEGENITYLDGSKGEDIESALKEFKAMNVDLIMTVTTPVTRKAKEALKGSDIPVVFGTLFDPVKGKVVESLINHKENVTGIKVGGNVQKALEWLRMIVPDMKRVFVPIKFDTKATELSLADLHEAAEIFDIDLLVSNIGSKEELVKALASIPEDIDAIFILNSIFIVSNIKTIVDTAIKRKLPIGSGPGQFRNGVVLSYSQEQKHSGEQAGRLAHEVLQGTPASSLPIETADFFLGINLITAEAIGLEIPHDILEQADFIVR